MKLLNLYYAPIKVIESPYSPFNYNTDKVELPEIDPSFEQFLNAVVKEIELNQHHGNWKMIAH